MRTFHLSDRFRVALLPFLALLILFLPAQLAAAQTALPWPPGGTPATTVAPTGAPTQPPVLHFAGVVVRYNSESVETRCVAFTESEIGGDELLVRAGLGIVTNDEGAVCAISGEGCPADDCFCACPFPDCQYWGYYHLTGGQWRYSDVGAGFYAIRDGDVDGWSWGEGDSQGALPVIPFERICPASIVTPRPTATGNYTPTPNATFTPVPTATATPIPPPPPAEIPEPATLLLLAPGLAALGAHAVKMRRR